jgi:hypothetical protein
MAAAALTVLAATAAACSPTPSSPEERAEDTARGDDRLPQEWREGEARTPIAGARDDWFVVIEMAEPVASGEYPLDVCAIPTPDTFDAIVWEISPDGDEILAVSPLWGDLSCLEFPVESETS